MEPSDRKNGTSSPSWWDKTEHSMSPAQTRDQQVFPDIRPSRADSLSVKNTSSTRGASLPRPPDRPPRGQTPDPPKRRNRSLSRGRKSKSPEPSEHEMEVGIVKGRLFGINVSSDNVKIQRSRENVGIEQVVETHSRRSSVGSISTSKDHDVDLQRSKEKRDRQGRPVVSNPNLDSEKDPATLIMEMRKEFVEYVKGRNRASEHTTKTNTQVNSDGGITHREQIPREQDDRMASEGDSSEFLLVLLPNSTTEERDLSRSETERALKSPESSVPPPMSLSAPELGAIEPDIPFMRNAVSSTELLHERAMARFYQEAEEAERALTRRMNVERRVSLERRLSIERKTREKVRLRARVAPTLVNETDEELDDYIPSNMTRFAGARPSKEIASPKRQIPRIRVSQEMTAEEKEEAEFAELRRRLSETNASARAQEKRRQLLETDSEDYFDEEQEEEMEEEERSLNRSEEELETYHPRIMAPPPPPASRYNTYTTTTEDDNAPSTLLTKRHSPSKGDVKPKPILKKRNSLKKERTDTPSPPAKTRLSKISTIKKIIPVEKPKAMELFKSGDTSTDSDVSSKRPAFNLFKSKRRQTDESPSRTVKLRSKPPRTPDQTPPVKRQSLNKSHPTTPEEELRVSAAEAAHMKRGIPRKESLKDEETKVVISHYSDIVREFGAAHKPVQARYLTYEELKAKAENLEKEKQESNSVVNRRLSRASSRDGRMSVSSSRDFSVTRSHSSIASSVSETRSLSPEAQIMVKQAEINVRSTLSYVTDVGIFLIAVWLFLFENELLAIPALLLLAYRQIEECVRKRTPTWFIRAFKPQNTHKLQQTSKSRP